MIGRITNLLSFRHLLLFPPLVCAAFYGLQSIAGLLKFQDEYAIDFICICLVVGVTYLLCVKYFFTERAMRKIANRRRRVRISFTQFGLILLLAYAALIVYAAATTEQVALFAALRGASLDELAHSREAFLRTRTGWESALLYLYAMFTMSLVPYVLATLFYYKHRLRFVVLGCFLFSLLLTLEKSVTLIAILPLIILYANRDSKKHTYRLLILLFLCIGAASLLSRGAVSDQSSDVRDELAQVPEQYNLFSSDGVGQYLANRVAWIPYATAYDWLRYRHEVLKDSYTYGSSISILSKVTGMEYIPLEREVFRFQWGQNDTGTGSANTVFYIDGFLNWGYPGAIAYTAVFAFIVKLLQVSDNVPAKAIAYVPLFYTCFNSLSAVLFSGGLGLLLLIVIFLHPPSPNIQKTSIPLSSNLRPEPATP